MNNLQEFARLVAREIKSIEQNFMKKSESRVLAGSGRPDIPETTNGVITGNEPNGAIYESHDGANVGAWEWVKRGGKWHVMTADTGWRKITTPGLVAGYVTIRRMNNQCFINATGGRWGTVTLLRPENNTDGYRFANGSLRVLKQNEIPVGFRSSVSLFLPIAHDGKVLDGTLYLGGTSDANWLGIHNYKDIMASQGALIRLPMLSYITDEAWPQELPGTKLE